MRLNYLLLWLLSTNVLANTAKMPDVKDFAKDDQWQEVKISPLGDYLSAVTRIDGLRVIAMIDAKTLKIIHTLKFRGNMQPGEYHWASNDRIVTETELLKGWSDHPVSYGEIYALDVQRGKSEYIFGYRNSYGTRSESMWGS